MLPDVQQLTVRALRFSAQRFKQTLFARRVPLWPRQRHRIARAAQSDEPSRSGKTLQRCAQRAAADSPFFAQKALAWQPPARGKGKEKDFQ